jgi:5'-methylthioadenosine phosphorylase
MNSTGSGPEVPSAEYAFIGGSGTYSCAFPEDLDDSDMDILHKDLIFSTPFGNSPPLKYLLMADGRKVLACRMHGWRPGTTRREASLQLFWVFREAGVKKIIAEGGVGTVHAEGSPGDLIIPDDYIDWSCRRDTALSDDYLLVMRDPLCPTLRRVLADTAARHLGGGHLATEGVYAVTDGRHFESRAEVRALASLGADVIGQSLAPEVYLAREIGACYAGVHQVVNRAEGIGEDWSHEELADLFRRRSAFMGRLAAEALAAIPAALECSCRELRKDTLLRPSHPSDPP